MVSVQFLTRIPLPVRREPSRETVARSIVWYPLVGLGMAVLCVAGYRYLFSLWWPEFVSRLLMLVCLIVLKDAFHLDGLSDWADGMYGGTDSESTYRIMKDPALGVMGGLALLIVLGLETAVVLTLPDYEMMVSLCLAVTYGTLAGGLVLCWGRAIKNHSGLGQTICSNTPAWISPIIIVMGGLIGYGLAGPAGLTVLGGVILFSSLFLLHFQNRMPGITGDGCGAVIMLVQTVVLLTMQAFVEQGWLTINSGIFS